MKLRLTAAQAAHSLAEVAIEYHRKGQHREAAAVVTQIDKDIRDQDFKMDEAIAVSGSDSSLGHGPLCEKEYPSRVRDRRHSGYRMFHVKHKVTPEEYHWPPGFLGRIWLAQP